MCWASAFVIAAAVINKTKKIFFIVKISGFDYGLNEKFIYEVVCFIYSQENCLLIVLNAIIDFFHSLIFCR